MTLNPALVHLQARGIYTAYWVLNNPKELNHVIANTKVEGIMTDRIEDLKGYYMPHVKQAAMKLKNK